MSVFRIRSIPGLAVIVLLGSFCMGANATVVAQIFDDARLGALLERIRELDEALRLGVDGSTTQLLRRLPGLWQELALLERQLQRSLPAMRDRLEALERELREWPPPAHSPPPGLISA